MKKTIHISEEEFLKPEWIDDIGDFNHFPTPHCSISDREFAATLSMGKINHIEYRQILVPDSVFRSVQLFWLDDCAIAIVAPAKWKAVDGKPEWLEPVLYFRIGCHHVYEEIQTSDAVMFEHTRQCKKCGTTHSCDSDG